ncbi:GNAT family N-acetyltransferase [Flagellimonas sp.]|uniref:GNAT family N-acetyltransferase n=1 Tax=Flagellimonas sp. TaxID=2058762 RepID=UPI003C7A0E06
MKIRTANNKDTSHIKKLVAACLREFGYEYLSQTSEADLQNIDKIYYANNGVFLIGLNDENEIIATGGIIEVNRGCFKLRKIYVAEAYRGNGFGKQIVEMLIKIAQLKKANQLVIETSSKMFAALSMYLSIGFQVSRGKITSPRCDIRLQYSYTQHQ